MSDKLSSPSSSSGYSPRTRGSASSDESSFITVRKHPPTYVYSNESFEVQLQLETPKVASPSAPSSQPIELGASLHHVKNGRECTSEAILITEPSRIDLSLKKKTCTIKCMIRMDGIRGDQGAGLEVRFTPKNDLSPSARSVIGASTKPITIVNYKVKITLEEEWDNVWYKDEGGRDKCMELFVAIYDKDGQIRTGEQIPLQPMLCYASESGIPVKVSNQEVMRTLGSSKVHIDKDSGKARIRFRVEDVSKNHQGQDFKLQVGPDPKAKLFKDVAPDYTPSVNVRSKRNKRSRAASSGSRGVGERKISSPMASRARYDAPPDVSLDRSDLSTLRDSMKNVLHWADEVVNGLYPLQWQIMGYAQHPDGTPDYASPYHNMPNPNGCINRILSMYSESVRENLRLISNAIDSTEGVRPTEQSYLPLPGALPASDDPYGMMRGQPGPMNPQVGLPTQSVNRRPVPGMLPPMGQETFRDKPDGPMPPFQPRGQMPPMHHPSNMGSVSIPRRQMSGPSPFMDPMLQNQPQHGRMMHQQQQVINHTGMHMHPDALNESTVESEVAYVLAKQYKAARTGERLGFPAYSTNKEILGFYREASGKVGVGSFHPLSRHRNDFGPLEVLQANDILERAIAKKSDAVHALKDWGTMANLLDHALVYDWSKDISGDPSNSSSE
ncbi:unnamed protein product [Cylindrotheca closterium]|uniref:Uncharacterized protein n=1 Tax=Cylindrotheca closterium TaxID=2856 RepID=A0AAD2FJX3_9STRA|nr:unnamed protein product [Cylindrotheca closterium]